MIDICVVVFLKLAADPVALVKWVADWALALFVIAIILGSTYHGLRFLKTWLFVDRRSMVQIELENYGQYGVNQTKKQNQNGEK